jgi:hypothetical protein
VADGDGVLAEDEALVVGGREEHDVGVAEGGAGYLDEELVGVGRGDGDGD